MKYSSDNLQPAIPPGMEPFLGIWLLVSSITDGIPAPEAEIQGIRVVISRDTKTVLTGDKIIAKDIPFSIDLSVTPRATTDFLPDGRQIQGIVKVEGDTLTSCVAAIGGERPKEFDSTPGSGYTRRVFKRPIG